MGSMSREALASARGVLADLGDAADLTTGEQLLNAGRIIGGSSKLLAYLADPAEDVVGKKAFLDRVFGEFTQSARALLTSIVGSRWSSHGDLLAGIEEIGIRTIAKSAPVGLSIEGELFAFGEVVASDAGLELAVGTKLSDGPAKSGLVERLLAGKASQQTISIVSQLVQQPRGRRIGELIRNASAIVADQSDELVAVVTSAAPIAQEQVTRLEAGLARQFGRNLRVNLVIDPSILGGLRVQVGDEVIDGTVSTRLSDLRLQLAG
ncbi:F0F1 ATP synthase subunit delta [Frondihabitans sp. Leaf304]|uniref:F0F1 ATP synthase subunit delta n=1 Tax=Frondihabitans sp. Leaf304 TaxID=1736329 RepID=UPI0006F4FCFB|nr:F0F1 ATP synthase subunit delta [Frondihabitans sp. Leaf304]KQQ27713.1 ATP synthase F0F1 subunit delta [Frondihabitans sp. Leaf304]